MSKARDLADSVSTGGILEDGAVSVSEISDLTVTAAELNNVAGVNSDVQTQLDLKAPLASPSFTGTVNVDGVAQIRGVTVKDSSGTTKGYVQGDADGLLIASDGSNNITFDVNATERMRIDSSGKVGIGTTTMQSAFNVVGVTNLANFSYPAAATELKILSTTVNAIGIYTGTDDNFVFGTNSTERMRISDTGNVGIGTTSPAAKLQVDGDLYVGDHTRILEDDDLKFVAPASTTGVQNARIAWWNENEAGIMAMIAVDRTGSTFAPADLVFYTTDNVDTLANSSEGDRSEKLRITSDGAFGINGTNYGTSGQVLTSGGSGAAPTWTTISAGAPFSGFGS